MTSLFKYDSYRTLIRELLNEKNITSSSVALTLGLRSKSYLGLILRGEKRLQDDQIHAFKEILSLSSAEFDYFYHLAKRDDAQNEAVRRYHDSKATKIKREQKKTLRTDRASEHVLTHWYYPAILLNASLSEPLSDCELAKALKIKAGDLEQARHELVRIELLQLRDGKFVPRTTRLKIAKKSWSQIQKKFLKSQIQNALSTFDVSYEAHGKFYSQTITFAKGSYESVWDGLKTQMDQLADQSDAETPEEVIQLNLQFYRLL